MKSKIDILNLEWTSFSSRDREAATLVCNYLRYQGFSVYEGSIFNGFYLLKKYRPKILFITNTTGAFVNQQVARFSKKLKIPVITTISEGNLRESAIQEMVWGHNKERILFEDKYLVWSSRSKKMILNHNKELSSVLGVSGSSGHDKYFILKNLLSHKKNKNKVCIGIGCWGFDYYMQTPKENDLISQSNKDFFMKERDDFNNILSEIIKNNQDCSFLFKEHPGNLKGHVGSGIESCVNFPNVKVYNNDKTIFDCILESDLWITYDSTTAMEGWLLDKQTCILNPSKSKWPHQRDQMHLSQPILNSVKDLQEAIDAIKTRDIISGFNDFKNMREKVIKEVIEWNDGLNHVRVGNEIIEFISNKCKSSIIDPKLELPSTKNIISQRLKWIFFQYFPFLPKPTKNEKYRIKWNKKELKAFSLKRQKQQFCFYEKFELSKEKLLKIRAK
jgi:surface carbohydrate biosynthesis protein